MPPENGGEKKNGQVADAPVDSPGPAIFLFPADKRLTDERVTDYRLDVDGGLPRDEDSQSFTQAARWAFSRYYGMPIATDGPLRLVAPRNLSVQLDVRDRNVTPVEDGQRSLDPSNDRDRMQLEDLVRADLRHAIPDSKFEGRFMNNIRRRDPAFVAESGDFAAHLKYDASVEVTAEGRPLLQVEVSHELRSRTTLNEIVQSGEPVKPYKVEHDPTVYDTQASGTVTGWSEFHYNDHIPSLGASIAETHEGTIDEELGSRLQDENPRLLTVEYGSFEGNQVPHVLTLTPSLSQIKDKDGAFHSRFNSEKGLQPGERYRHAASFVTCRTSLPSK